MRNFRNNTKLFRVTLCNNSFLVNIYATYRSHAIDKDEFIDNIGSKDHNRVNVI